MKDYSQSGEQSIISDILVRLQINTATIVDLGAGVGWSLSNGRRLIECGWRGVLIDLNNHGNPEVHEHFLTVENVVPILAECTTDVDGLASTSMGTTTGFWTNTGSGQACFGRLRSEPTGSNERRPKR
jgi:hypothetical protein